MSKNEKLVVQKRNILNELRSNKMTLQELRFFCIYLAKINAADISTRKVKMSLEDYQRIMEFGRTNIKQIRASTDELLRKLIHLNDDGEYEYRVFQLFKECYIFRDKKDDNRLYIVFDAHDNALPLLFEFKNKYVQYDLWNVLSLKSPNQIRMYEILKQYEKVGKRELTIEKLKELIGINKKEYGDRWDNFRKRVIDSCQQALKDNTDICYTYERGKTGRGGKWISIIFHIYKNDSYKNPLSLEEFLEQQPPVIPITTESDGDGEDMSVPINQDDSESLEHSKETTNQNNFAETIDLNDNSYSKTVESNLDDFEQKLISVCNYEFSNKQINALKEKLSFLTNNDNTTAERCLRYCYSIMDIADMNKQKKGEKINDRFAYLQRIIENELKAKEKNESGESEITTNQYGQKVDKTTGLLSSFDMSDLDGLDGFAMFNN